MILTVLVMAVGAVTATNESLFSPSESTLRKVWEVGRQGRHNWGESRMPGFHAGVLGLDVGGDLVSVAWLTPLSYAYGRGWDWTLKPQNYPFQSLFQSADLLKNRLMFEVSLSAPLVLGSDSRKDKSQASLDKATFTLLVGKDRIQPASAPSIVSKLESGEIQFADSKLVNDGSWDHKGNRIDPVYETTHYSEKYYHSRGSGLIDFTGNLPATMTLEKLVESDLLLEVGFRDQVYRLAFRRKDREKALAAISKVQQ